MIRIIVYGWNPPFWHHSMNPAIKTAVIASFVFLTIDCSKGRSVPAANASNQPEQRAEDHAPTAPLERESQTTATALSAEQVDYTGWKTVNAVGGKAVDPAGRLSEPTQVELDLLGKLRAVNPGVNHLQLVSVMLTWSLEGGTQYVVIANGTSPDATSGRVYPDKYTNLAHAADIFGIFVINHDYTKAVRRIGLFISPRTGDYSAWLVRPPSDSAIVCGQGAMYGDQRNRWAFAVDPVRDAKRRAEDSTYAAVAAAQRDSAGKDSARVSDEEDGAGDGLPPLPPPDCPWLNAKG